MGLEIDNNIKSICEDISRKCSHIHPFEHFEFVELLRSSSAVEKYLIAKYFCMSPWNVGSLRMLGILQTQRIITATEFILSLQDNEQIHLILNDFLEAEYELIINLLITAHYDAINAVKFNCLLDECLKHLFIDLLQNPKLNDLSYLKSFKDKLPNDLLTKIMQKHLEIILQLHTSAIKEAFPNFSTWINEGVDDIKFTKDLHSNFIRFTEQNALSHLFKMSALESFNGWKFYIILLQTVASRCSSDNTAFIKKYFKTRLHQIAAMPCKTSMLHLLLTARAATATTMDMEKNINNYADWYKQNISDMKFVLSVDEFRNTIALFDECIEYESEIYYLEVHASISISPPVLCGKLTNGYKSKCKSHLAKLKFKAKQMKTEKCTTENKI